MTNIIFVHGDTPRDRQIFAAISAGIRHSGDEIEELPPDVPPMQLDCDYVGLYGLRRMDWIRHCIEEGQPFLYFDHGYKGRGKGSAGFWRVGVNETHPAEYVYRAKHNTGRMAKMKVAMGLPQDLAEWRVPTKDGPIIIASSSEKFHELHDMPSPREWVGEVIREVRKHTNRPILYRPKPSWGDPGPIDGSKCVVHIKHMNVLFAKCHALITHGSYICVDAMLAGVPSIVLGNGVLRHISSTNISEVEEPRLASYEERERVMANLAWCQYTVDEWANGVAWQSTKRLFL